jgi:parallel beta-helix repeat protein
LNGSSAGAAANGLKVAGGNSTIKGFVINRFGARGILLHARGGNKVADNYIGTDRAGSTALANKGHGIMLWSSGNCVDHNLVSGNAHAGVFAYTGAASHNTISGNFVGTDAAGAKSIPNYIGVQLNGGASNTIGGATAAARNVISGNKRDGVLIVTTGAQHNTVLGNYIGTNAAGNARLGNGWYGVEISQPNNLVGGTTPAARNVISANGISGVVMYLATGVNNRVQGNYVGTDNTGTKDLGNTTAGIEITNGAKNNTVGGDTKAAANLIAGNDAFGVGIYNHSANNTVRYNRIGIASSGAALPNAKHGVLIATSTANLICDNTVACCGSYKSVWVASGASNNSERNTNYLKVTAGKQLI